MFKKNSWIVALLLALSLTAFFISCVDPYVEPKGDDDETFEEFELTKFNVDNGENQKGWGTDGVKYGDGGSKTADPNLGLTVEMLQKAKYLVVEVNDGFPKNNFETIWQSYDADGNKIGDWQQFSSITSGSGVLNPGMGEREGNILKLPMAKIIKNYSLFKDPATDSMFLIIQHWGNGGPAACIKSAKLLISNEVEPFVPVTGITYTGATSGAMSLDINLSATVAPETATKQRIVWSIVGFLPDGLDGTLASNWLTIDNTSATTWNTTRTALLAKVDFKTVSINVIKEPASTYMDYSVYPAREVTIPAVTEPGTEKSPNIIVATAAGKVKVRAIILGGATEAGGDFVSSEFEIEVSSLIPYVVPAGGAGYFYVDLNDWETTSPAGVHANATVKTESTTATDKITVNFTLEQQRVNFGFTAAQKAILDTYATSTSNSVTIEIVGSVTGGTADSFRYHLGDATSGGNWNATSGSGDGTLATRLTSTQTFSGNATSTGKPTHFILQHRADGAVTVEITSIKITYGGVNIDVAGTVQKVTVSTLPGKGTVELAGDDGYTYTYAQTGSDINYGNGYAFFKLDLGTDKLEDFADIKVTFEGISGDTGWKDFRLFASPTPPDPLNGYISNTSGSFIMQQGTSFSGNPAKEFTFTLTGLSSAGWNTAKVESVLYFVFMIPAEENKNSGGHVADGPTKYTISGITFEK